ncbi:MAG: Hsp20/alpha crystallin family protein [Actinomycetes bacterium]
MALVRRDWPDVQELVQRLFEGDAERSWLRVEEFVDGTTQVVRAELPDIDPDKDVELAVVEGQLHIKARRQARSEHKDKDGYRSEFQYGSYARSIPLPPGATVDDVSATYKDGVLEVRVPVAELTKPAPTKIPISRG